MAGNAAALVLRALVILVASFGAVSTVLGASLQAQTDRSVYADAPLADGWQDWSWAAVDVASADVVHGGATSISVAAGPWGALALRHDPFDTTAYGQLSFWINGGPAGQSRLQVIATLDDMGQVAVPIGPIAANAWQQISIPLSSLAADDVPNLTGFWFQEGAGTDHTLNPFYVDDILLLAKVPTVPAPPLEGGVPLYTDVFASGWQNWSWAIVDPANPSPVNSGSSSIAVTAPAYSALRFHHDPVDTRGYGSLTFWINGGSAGGQLLSLNTLIADVAQPGVIIGPLMADTWQKVTVPLPSLGAADTLALTDVWLQEITGIDAPTFYVDDVRLDASPPPAVVNVAIDAKNAVRRVDARTFGINAAVWDGAFGTTTTVGLLQEVDNQALRFPGGSMSNVYHWQTNMSEGNTFQWATSFDTFASVAKATRAQVFITVNYGSGTPEEAAAWVKHSNRDNCYDFKYWEVGNENFGSWEVDVNTRPHDPVTYATRFAEYVRQMKAVDPSIKIGAVIEAHEDIDVNYPDEVVVNPRTGANHSGWSEVMLATFRQLGVTPDFVAYHRYEQGDGVSDPFLLQSSRGWAADAAGIRQMLSDYLGASGKRVEIDSTETNSTYAVPGKQTTSLVNALYLADSLGNIMGTEISSCMWWDLRNGRTSGDNSSYLYGWRKYGDYGIVDAATPAGPADRYPTFYVYKLLQHFARGGETVVAASSDDNRLGVYAVHDDRTQTLNLLMINKHPASSLNASIKIDGFRFCGPSDVYTYGIPQDEAARTGTGLADVAQTSVAMSGPNITYAPAPYSATVIKLRGSASHHARSDCAGFDR